MKFKKGDIVRVITLDPKFGWGSVDNGDIGVYSGDDPMEGPGVGFVDFPTHTDWHCKENELKRVINVKEAVIEFGEDNMNKAITWSFGSAATLDIDYNLISLELSKTNPLALIEIVGKENEIYGVMVHDSLAIKANVCHLLDPSKGSGHVIVPNTGYIIRCKLENFSDWIAWAKQVKEAKWPIEYKRKCMVKVTLVKI
jgi:hypothetical protein